MPYFGESVDKTYAAFISIHKLYENKSMFVLKILFEKNQL